MQAPDGVITISNTLFSGRVSVGLRLRKGKLSRQDLRIAELAGELRP